MSQSSHQPSLLVTGASGKLGRRVVELLLEKGATSIIAATRTPEKLPDFAARGVVVRPADFDDSESLASAFAGADRLLLISTDVVDVEGTRLRQHQNAVRAADAVGVKHVLYTSIVNPTGTPILIAPSHAGTEQALVESSLGYTMLRNSIYMDELPAALERAIGMGAIYSAAGDGKISYVTREDCAQVAAAALLDSFEGRRILDVTGPEAVGQADLARIASELSGKAVQYVPLSVETYTNSLLSAGLPRLIVDLIISFDEGAAQGRLDVVSETVAVFSGKPPTSVREFITAQLGERAGS